MEGQVGALTKQAEDLLQPGNPYKAQVFESYRCLEDDWAMLSDYAKNRGNELKRAGEVHSFQAQWGEMMDLIEEKSDGIPETPAKDFSNLEARMQRYKVLDAEMAGLERQVDSLTSAGQELQAKYPEEELLELKLRALNDRWCDLLDKKEEWRGRLLRAFEFHTFRENLNATIDWARSLISELREPVIACSVDEVEEERKRHADVRREIGIKEPLFQSLIKFGDTIQDQAFKEEASAKIITAVDIKAELKDSWVDRGARLQESLDYNLFVKKADQLLTSITKQLIAVNACVPAPTVEETKEANQRLETLDRLTPKNNARFRDVESQAIAMINADHPDREGVEERMEDLQAIRDRIGEALQEHRTALAAHLVKLNFVRDLVDLDSWLEEKMVLVQQLLDDRSDSVEARVEVYRKAEDLRKEVEQNRKCLLRCQANGNLLSTYDYPDKAEIHARINEVAEKWTKLSGLIEKLSAFLVEAQAILAHYAEADSIERWLLEKKAVVLANDKGADLDHCRYLQRRLTAPVNGIEVDKTRVERFQASALDLIAAGNIDSENLRDQTDRIISTYEDTAEKMAAYGQLLDEAAILHSFNSEANDLKANMKEFTREMKAMAMEQSFEGAQRQVTALLSIGNDIVRLEVKVELLGTLGTDLLSKFPAMKQDIEQRLADIDERMEKMKKLNKERLEMARFLRALYKLKQRTDIFIDWANTQSQALNSSSREETIDDVTQALARNEECRAEMEGRFEGARAVQRRAQELLVAPLGGEEPFRGRLQQVEAELVRSCAALQQSWDRRQKELQASERAIIFENYTKDLLKWLDSCLAKVQGFSCLGSTVREVQFQLNKLTDFEKQFSSEKAKSKHLQKFAKRVVEADPNSKPDVDLCLQAVSKRTQHVRDVVRKRYSKLGTELRFQKNLEKIADLAAWLEELEDGVRDESFKNLTNLQAKIEQHDTRMEELVTKRELLNSLLEEAAQLLRERHHSSEADAAAASDLTTRWNAVVEAADAKSRRLSQALSGSLLLHRCEELDLWLAHLEEELSHCEAGEALHAAKRLLRQHDSLAKEVESRALEPGELRRQLRMATEDVEEPHFMEAELKEKVERACTRYEEIPEALRVRRGHIEDSLRLHHLREQHSLQLAWADARIADMEAAGDGDSWWETQQRQREHERVATDIRVRGPEVEAVLTLGRQLQQGGHFAAEEIGEKAEELSARFKLLTELSEARVQRLSQMLDLLLFRQEVAEVQKWLEENLPVVQCTEISEEEAELLESIQRLRNVRRDFRPISSKVHHLTDIGKDLCKDHFDAAGIQEQSDQLNRLHDAFHASLHDRKKQLADGREFSRFKEHVDECMAWIQRVAISAGSKDYGRNWEHCQLLMESFKAFTKQVRTGDRMIAFNNQWFAKLSSEGSCLAPRAKELNEAMNKEYASMRSACRVRWDALAGAQRVHSFSKDVKEIKDWISEKRTRTEEEQEEDGQAEDRLRRFEEFQTDMEAIANKVKTLKETFSVLCAEFPDASDYLTIQKEDLELEWNDMQELNSDHLQELHNAVKLQRFLQHFDQMMDWIIDMGERLILEETATDVGSAERQLEENAAHRKEMQAHRSQLQRLIKKFHRSLEPLLSEPSVRELALKRLDDLRRAFDSLDELQQERRCLYEENLDLRRCLAAVEALELWLKEHAAQLSGLEDPEAEGQTLTDIERQLCRQVDLERALHAQAVYVAAISRLTLLEQRFEVRRMQEERKRRASAVGIDLLKKESAQAREDMRSIGSASTRRDSAAGLRSSLRDVSKGRRDSGLPGNDLEREAVLRRMSFSTRRASVKEKEPDSSRPPAVFIGNLERRQTKLRNGRPAALSAWRPFFVTLCSNQLLFFIDEDQFNRKEDPVGSIDFSGAACEVVRDPERDSNVIEIRMRDGSEFLLAAASQRDVWDWCEFISFYAVPQGRNRAAASNPEPPSDSSAASSRDVLPPSPPDSILSVESLPKDSENSEDEFAASGRPKRLEARRDSSCVLPNLFNR